MKMADQTLLIGICILCTSLAAILFGVEISLHNTWYNWLSTLLCLGMFVVPGITSSLRRKGEGCVKVLADTVFVLYGIVTLSITSLSVGLAGDSPWGCGFENLFECEHHPGMWGAMLFGIASITGHAFGWNRIKDQQTQKDLVNQKAENFGDMMMKKFEIDNMNTKNGRLIYSVNKTFKPLNKTNLLSGLNMYFKNDDQAKTVTQVVLDNREKVEKVNLRRTINKKAPILN